MIDKLLRNSDNFRTDSTITQERAHSRVCETRQKHMLYQENPTTDTTPKKTSTSFLWPLLLAVMLLF